MVIVAHLIAAIAVVVIIIVVVIAVVIADHLVLTVPILDLQKITVAMVAQDNIAGISKK